LKQSLIKKLTAVGLSDKESSVYLAVLELGEATATSIAKRSGVERTTSYNILPSLVSEGLVDYTEKRGVKYFYVHKVEALEQRQEKILLDTKTLVPELKAVKKNIPQHPKVSVFEGIQGFRRIYEDVIESPNAGQEILAYAGSSEALDYIPKNTLIEFMNKRVNKKLQLRILVDENTFTKELEKENLTKLRKIKFLRKNENRFHGETIIYNGKVAMISYAEGFLGTIIESNEIYNMQKSIFEELWDTK
jgi:sugar-specific transcriptional regulator TrmB